jgi:hypothetical protein
MAPRRPSDKIFTGLDVLCAKISSLSEDGWKFGPLFCAGGKRIVLSCTSLGMGGSFRSSCGEGLGEEARDMRDAIPQERGCWDTNILPR